MLYPAAGGEPLGLGPAIPGFAEGQFLAAMGSPRPAGIGPKALMKDHRQKL